MYGIYSLYNYSLYVDMVLSYKSISKGLQDFVSEMLYKQNSEVNDRPVLVIDKFYICIKSST